MPMDKLEEEFDEQAAVTAKNLAPGITWGAPQPTVLNPRDPIAVANFVKKEPKNFWARQKHTLNLLGAEDWEAAAKSADELIKLHPDYVENNNGYRLKAAAFRALGKPDQEAAALRALAEKSAEALPTYDRLMELDLEKANWPELEKNTRRTMAINPFSKRLHFCAGCAHEALDRRDEAVRSFEKLLTLKPANPSETRFRLARLQKEDDPVAARRYLLDALADAPRYRDAHRLLLEMVDEKVIDSALPAPGVQPPRPPASAPAPVSRSCSRRVAEMISATKPPRPLPRARRLALRSRRFLGAVLLLLIGTASTAWVMLTARAQDREGRSSTLSSDVVVPTNFGSRQSEVPEDPREAFGGQMYDFPVWEISRETPNDVFIFARLRYSSGQWGRRPKWMIDYPDCDLNISYRLQQLTSLEVSPYGAVVDIDAEQMRNYPFIYMIEPGDIYITDDEAASDSRVPRQRWFHHGRRLLGRR